MIETYKPSGKIGGSTLVFAVLAALWMGAGMYLYQLLLDWIPLIYVNFLLTLGAGIVGAYAVTKAVRGGKCRNPAVAATLGFFIAVIAVGVKHFLQYDTTLTKFAEALQQESEPDEGGRVPTANEVKTELRQEFTFADYLEYRAETGWSIGRGAAGGMEVTGVFVYLIWLIEAGIIIYFSVTGPREEAGRPFNEELEQWADAEEDIGVVTIEGSPEVTRLQSARTVDELVTLPTPEPMETNEFLTYKSHSIPGQDEQDAYLSIVHSTVTVNKKGETQNRATPLWTFAVLPSGHRQQLLEAFVELDQRRARVAAAAAETATDSAGSQDHEETEAADDHA